MRNIVLYSVGMYVSTFWVMLHFFPNNITGFSTIIVFGQNHEGKNKEEPHIIFFDENDLMSEQQKFQPSYVLIRRVCGNN